MTHTTNTTDQQQWSPILPQNPIPSHSSSRRVQQRRHYSSLSTIALANSAIISLNQLSNSCNINPHLLPSSASHRHQLQPPTIHRCHRHVDDSCDHFRRFGSSDSLSGDVSSDIDDKLIHNDSFGYSSTVAVRTIVADSVSLQKEAGTANLLDVLPPHLVSLFSKPNQLLVPPATALYRKRPVLLSSPEQYRILIKRMMRAGMIAFTTKPKAV